MVGHHRQSDRHADRQNHDADELIAASASEKLRQLHSPSRHVTRRAVWAMLSDFMPQGDFEWTTRSGRLANTASPTRFLSRAESAPSVRQTTCRHRPRTLDLGRLTLHVSPPGSAGLALPFNDSFSIVEFQFTTRSISSRNLLAVSMVRGSTLPPASFQDARTSRLHPPAVLASVSVASRARACASSALIMRTW